MYRKKLFYGIPVISGPTRDDDTDLFDALVFIYGSG